MTDHLKLEVKMLGLLYRNNPRDDVCIEGRLGKRISGTQSPVEFVSLDAVTV
jgi:hypothetical protein